MDIHWKELMNADGRTRYKLLQTALGISYAQVDSVIGDPRAAAVLVYKKCLEQGLKKHQALAKIKTHTMAALVIEDWSDSVRASRRFSRMLSELYQEEQQLTREFTGKIFPFIHFLREETFNHVSGKHIVPNAVKSDWDVRFSKYDLVRGTKLPQSLDELAYTLLGTYWAIGGRGGGEQYYLNVAKRNREYIDGVVHRAIKHIFNIDKKLIARPSRKKTGWNGHEYTITCWEFSVSSTAHRQFVEKYCTAYTESNGARTYVLPSLLFDDSRTSLDEEQRFYSLLIGAIAGRATISKENGSKVMHVFDQNISYLTCFQGLSERVGVHPTLNPKNDSQLLRFSRRDIENLIESESHPTLTEQYPTIVPAQRGIFINPRHLSQLAEF